MLTLQKQTKLKGRNSVYLIFFCKNMDNNSIVNVFLIH
jgi:hypothetical protein